MVILRGSLIFLICFFLVASFSRLQAQQVKVLLEEGFEGNVVGRDNPQGWTVIEGHVAAISVVDTPVHSGTRSMKAIGVSQTEDRMAREFSTKALIITTELYTNISAKTTKNAFSMSLDNGDFKNPDPNGGSQDRALLVRFLDNGNIGWSHGGNIPDAQIPYVADKWYHIKIVAKLDTDTYDIYVDDMNVPKEADVRFTNPKDTLNYLCFHFPGQWEGIYFVDDILIYEGDKQGKAVDRVGKKAVVWGYIKQAF